jgi:uncharacterized protein with WD repeat
LKQADYTGKNAASAIKVSWPAFKWSHDDKYLARMVSGPNGMISVYETPGMGLLDKKSIKVFSYFFKKRVLLDNTHHTKPPPFSKDS